MAEWLRRLPAKQFPFGSVGSNPAVVVFCLDGIEYSIKKSSVVISSNRKKKEE